MKVNKMANEQLIQIGLNVRFYRDLVNLTQAELSERAEISISALSKLENSNQYNNSELLTLLKIAIALDINPAKLFEFRTKQ